MTALCFREIRVNPRLSAAKKLLLSLDLLALGGRFQGALGLGHALGIKNLGNFLLAQQLLLSRDFNYGTPGGD
jgi:hypothetical protein